jgi:hypothetical protein
MANLRDAAVANELASRPESKKGPLAPGIYSDPKVVIDQSGNVTSVTQAPVVAAAAVPSSDTHTTLPDGTIMQWCQGAPLDGTQNGEVFSTDFPIPFPNAIFQATVCGMTTGTDYGEMPAWSVTEWDETSVSYYYQRNADHGDMIVTPLIFAIGK